MKFLCQSRLLACTTAIATGLFVSGCGADDVELNGKIFDAMGVSGSSKNRGEEKQIRARNGLVVPPNTGSLPPPGSGRDVSSEADLAFINDPDRTKQIDKAELERRQAEFCKVNYEQPKARGDNSVDSIEGPAGPCRATFLSAMKKWGSDEEAEGQ
ncbi:MAG: hypothetical protein ACK5KM_04920 [Hyphomicrobiaceae bacterium]